MGVAGSQQQEHFFLEVRLGSTDVKCTLNRSIKYTQFGVLAYELLMQNHITDASPSQFLCNVSLPSPDSYNKNYKGVCNEGINVYFTPRHALDTIHTRNML